MRWLRLLLAMALLNEQGFFVSEALAQVRVVAPASAGAPVTPVAAPNSAPKSVSLSAPLTSPSLALTPSLALPAPVVAPAPSAQASAVATAKAAKALSAPVAAPKAIAVAARAQDFPEGRPEGAAERLETLGSALKAPAKAAALNAAFDGSDIKVFLTQHGQEPTAIALSALRGRLASDAGYAAALNAKGRVRLVLGGRLDAAGAQALKTALAESGVSAPIVIERLPEAPKREESAGGDVSTAPKNKLLRILTAPFREAAYLARTIKASYTKPTAQEFWGGVVSKGPAFVLSTMWWAKLFLPIHPIAFGAALGFSFALQAFHGVWINTWQNFQNIISRQRGLGYQTVFNFLYMQSTAALFRMISYAVIAGTVPPWTLAYWRDMGIATVFGTFFGTLGYAGVNSLYDKGRISRSTRSYIQQGRDLFFLLAGTFFASGSMTAFWTLFVIQQSVDIALYIAGQRSKARPIAVVADPDVAESSGFNSLYSVQPGAAGRSPLKDALNAVLGIFGIRRGKK